MKAQLKATALPTDAKLPDEPTATEEQRRVLRHSKVLGNIGLVRRIASFIPDKERGEEAGDFLEDMEELNEIDEECDEERDEEQDEERDEERVEERVEDEINEQTGHGPYGRSPHRRGCLVL
jgi:hypothetical protein